MIGEKPAVENFLLNLSVFWLVISVILLDLSLDKAFGETDSSGSSAITWFELDYFAFI